MDVRERADKAAATVRRLAPRAGRAASDRKLRRHLRGSAAHAVAAGSQMRRRRRRRNAGLTAVLTDRRARRHLRESVRQLAKANRRLRRTRSHGLRNALLVTASGAGAVALFPRVRGLLRRHDGDAHAPGTTSERAEA